MKTWEMIKELTRHPEKKFKSINANDQKCEVVVRKHKDQGGGSGDMIVISHNGKPYEVFDLVLEPKGSLRWEWEEVKTPYTLQEAVEICEKDHVRFLNEDKDEIFYDRAVCITYNHSESYAILNCDWFRK